MGELLTEHDGGGGVDGDGFRGHFPVPAACRNRDSVPRIGVSRWRRRPWSLSGVSSIRLGFLGRGGFYRRRGGVGGATGPPPHRLAARGPPAPPYGVGPLLPASDSPSMFWNLPGKIRYLAFVSSNSENIARTAFLEPKTTENRNWHFDILLIG